MCNCITSFNEQLAEHNTILVFTLFGKPPRVAIETAKREDRKRGRPVRVIANFCPFCGEQYETPDAHPEVAEMPGRES